MDEMIQFGLSLPLSGDITQLIGLSIKAEEAGFDYIWMPDHILSLDLKEPLNVWSVLSILATQTKYVHLGSFVANIYRQHPLILYNQISSLNRISGNRAVLGIGVGAVFDTAPIGIKRNRPLKRMKETIQTIKSRIDIPIYVGTSGPKIKRLTGRMADGWIGRPALSIDEYEKEMSEVKRWVSNRPFDYIADLPVSFKDEPWLWKSLAYRYLLQTNFKDMVFSNRVMKEIEDASSRVPREVLENISAVGNEDEIIEVLEHYVDLGVTLFSIRLYCNSFEKFREVIRYFKHS